MVLTLFQKSLESKFLKNLHLALSAMLLFIVVQSLSCVQLFVTAWTTAHQASLSFTVSWSLLKLCPLSHWCHPTLSSSVTFLSSCPQSFQNQDLFQWVDSLHQVTKVWGCQSIYHLPNKCSYLVLLKSTKRIQTLYLKWVILILPL